MAVRSDITVGLQMAQAVHAAFLFACMHPETTADWMRDSQYLVVVSVPDEGALAALVEQAGKRNILHTVWHEPDLGGSGDARGPATAVAFAPIRATRRLCANLPLAGRHGKGAPR